MSDDDSFYRGCTIIEVTDPSDPTGKRVHFRSEVLRGKRSVPVHAISLVEIREQIDQKLDGRG